MTQKIRTFIALIALLAPTISTQLISAPVAQAATVGSSPCISNVQTSGTAVVASAGGNCYVAFLSGSNTWTPPTGVTQADLLIIAGGGAGGSGAWAGGGGAGGVVYVANKSVTSSTTYSLAVGAGGSAGAANLDGITNRSNNGSNSWFESNSTLVAIGGGAGASYAWSTGSAPYSACDGNSGGSGGGAPECNNGSYTNDGGASTQTIPAGATAAYGNAGGGTPTANYASGGGGGGAGTAGTSVTVSSTAGRGGNGTTLFASWLTAISSAMSGVSGWSTATSGGYIAAGGGGSANTAGAGGTGGGGGGGSASVLNGTAGVTNTGSGGGGAGYTGSSGTGGAGATGLIIIKYALASTISIAINGNPVSVIFNQPVTITATIVGVDGAVTFYADGKVITKCIAKPSTGLNSTCSWKPIVHRMVSLTAKLINSSSVFAPAIRIPVAKRSSTR
ncbi:MAG: glycine-rich domain-containing protein [Candidatus Planktophila sp.]